MGESGSLESKDKTVCVFVEEDLVSCDYKNIRCGLCGCFSKFQLVVSVVSDFDH